MTITRTLTDVGCLLNHLPWEPWSKPFSPNCQIKQNQFSLGHTSHTPTVVQGGVGGMEPPCGLVLYCNKWRKLKNFGARCVKCQN